MSKREITEMRALAREYYSLPRAILAPLELAARMWKHDRPNVSKARQTTIEAVERACKQEYERATG